MRRDTGPSKTTVALVLARDGEACARCGRGVDLSDRGWGWSIHHRCPRGMGGSKAVPWINLAANLVTLCGSGTAGCHGHIEKHREQAYADGWLVSRLRLPKPDEVRIQHARHGLVLLDNFGGVSAWEGN